MLAISVRCNPPAASRRRCWHRRAPARRWICREQRAAVRAPSGRRESRCCRRNNGCAPARPWAAAPDRTRAKGLPGLIQPFPALLETILQQHFRACAAIAVIEFGGIDGHRALHLLEQVFVVHDVAEGLVLAVKPVRAADRLEQPVVLHGLVDVEIGAARRIEAGEQLVHHDEQPHVRRLLDEQLLHLILVGFGLGLAGLGVDVLRAARCRCCREIAFRSRCSRRFPPA